MTVCKVLWTNLIDISELVKTWLRALLGELDLPNGSDLPAWF